MCLLITDIWNIDYSDKIEVRSFENDLTLWDTMAVTQYRLEIHFVEAILVRSYYVATKLSGEWYLRPEGSSLIYTVETRQKPAILEHIWSFCKFWFPNLSNFSLRLNKLKEDFTLRLSANHTIILHVPRFLFNNFCNSWGFFPRHFRFICYIRIVKHRICITTANPIWKCNIRFVLVFHIWRFFSYDKNIKRNQP